MASGRVAGQDWWDAPPVPRPFQGNFPITLFSAVMALAPFIVISTAYTLYAQEVTKQLHISETTLEIIAGLANGGYAWGALLGGDLVQRFPQRRLFLGCEALFVLGCFLCAVHPGGVGYGVGRVLAGLATGMLLVIALPPVVQKFPHAKLPFTVAFIDIAFFGAVCIGPLLGGWVAAGQHWQWFYGGLAALGAGNLIVAALTLPDQPPLNPGQPFDWHAMVLGILATGLTFWAAGELTTHHFASLRFLVPFCVGIAAFVALLLTEYYKKDAISPVKAMWNTQPVVGTLIAIIAGGVFVSFLQFAINFHMRVAHQSPLQTGVLFWPLAAGTVITSVALGALIGTRFVSLLVLAGFLFLIGGGGMLLALGPHAVPAVTLGASALLGLGAGATVSPGLYLAGFSVSSKLLGRVFALVELVRSVADYVISPVMLRIARNASRPPLDAHGIHLAILITLAVTGFFTLLGIFLYVAGGAGLHKPDLHRWIEDQEIAIKPTPLLARLRG